MGNFTDTLLNQRYEYTLPNGKKVILKPLAREDYDVLNKWVQTQYMRNVKDACEGLSAAERMELQLAALSYAATLNFQSGDGQQILFNNAYGLSRLTYQLIENPPFSFEEYDNMLFPNSMLCADGLETMNDIMKIAYKDIQKIVAEEVQKMQDLEEKVEEEQEEREKEFEALISGEQQNNEPENNNEEEK